MYFVYLLQSLKNPLKQYVGYTSNLDNRLNDHNAGRSVYTAADKPWKVVSFVGFAEKSKAIEFERYLKSQSGRAFAKKRLW